MINTSSKRVSNTLKNTYKNSKDSYAQIFLSYLSQKFLIENQNHPKNMVILYVDLVGSTALTAILNPVELSMNHSDILSRNFYMYLKIFWIC